MTARSLEKIRNIGFIAHIDAGKTTVTERTLFFAGRIYKIGNVDDGTTVTDYMAQERERGITIKAAATAAEWKGHTINIIDTPGHVDFTAEVERSLRVLDGGVVVFDAVAGVQPQSETVWRQAARYKVPRICFVNKMDRIGANLQRTIDSIVRRLNGNPVAIQIPIGAEDKFSGVIDLVEERALMFAADITQPPEVAEIPADMRDEYQIYRTRMLEKVAETDDALMEKYLEEKEITHDELKAAIRKATIANLIVPVVCGTALKSKGVQPLLDAVVAYLPSPLDLPPVIAKDVNTGKDVERGADPAQPFAALVFKAIGDPYIGRLVFFRVYSGVVKTGAMVMNSTTGKRERLGRLVKMHAQHREEVEVLEAGDIAAAVGLKSATTGDTICDETAPVMLEAITFPEPVVSLAVEPKARADQDKLTEALIKLADEDPTLKVSFDAEVGQTIISGMGELHLDIIVDRMRREFKVDANVGKPKVAYREAIKSPARGDGRFVRQTGGHGQYGHAVIQIEPLPRGEGFVFEEQVKGGAIPRQFINPIKEGCKEAMSTGPVGGYPVVDVKVVLVDGSYHDVDSSEMAFKVAGSMAMKDALARAKGVILEPVMRLEIITPGDFLGEIIGDLGRRRAQIKNIEGQDDIQVVKAMVPLGESFGYANTIRSLTQGRASYSMEFAQFEEAPASVLVK
ncbi:MAG: elongation factor G [SAR202 cluster bacterium]|nr:elongation factor G [SAR202 cluster bacterium]